MTKFYWHNYRYFPYERVLARRELEVFASEQPQEFMGGLEIKGTIPTDSALQTTYFSEVILDDGTNLVPLQAKLEASSNGTAQNKSLNSAKRQRTRYSSHGMHEYRGKFNPQIVRVIGNILGLKSGDWLLDPFCGSGTTLVEALHSRWQAVGIDRNPLAVEIANAKIVALTINNEVLNSIEEQLVEKLTQRIKGVSFENKISKQAENLLGGSEWRATLPSIDYLSSWFTEDVLIQLAIILQEIQLLSSSEMQLIAKVILSDIVREVSLQEPSDLRIRRRKYIPETIDVISLFLKAIKTKLKTIRQARQYLGQNLSNTQIALYGDTRSACTLIHASNFEKIKFDAAITSPPYATGLPYVDTDRLSLVLLGLIDADRIHETQRALIGSREISNPQRAKLLDNINENTHRLPKQCIELCREMKETVSGKDGFRRQNVPAVIYDYLAGMAVGFSEIHKVLKQKAPFALVVGKNNTTLGGKQFIIETPELLVELAIGQGFEFEDMIELNTYQRFDIHQANSIRSEYLLILRTK